MISVKHQRAWRESALSAGRGKGPVARALPAQYQQMMCLFHITPQDAAETKPRRGPGRPPSGQPHKGSYSYRAESALKAQADLKAEAEGTTLSALIEGWLAGYVKGD